MRPIEPWRTMSDEIEAGSELLASGLRLNDHRPTGGGSVCNVLGFDYGQSMERIAEFLRHLNSFLGPASERALDRAPRYDPSLGGSIYYQLLVILVFFLGFVLAGLVLDGRLCGVSWMLTADCVDEMTLQELAAGIAPPEVIEKRLPHIATCDRCASLLKQYLHDFSDELTPEEEAILAQLESSKLEWQKAFAILLEHLNEKRDKGSEN